MPAIQILLGGILLLMGRRLYWIFVGFAGFLAGFQLADVALVNQGQMIRILAALAAGALGALLAMVAQRVGFALGGLYAGGYLALALAASAGSTGNHLLWFGIGGLLGAILAAVLMDWGIIALSSLVGAGAIVAGFGFEPTVSVVVFLVLTVVGVIAQGRQLEPKTSDS